MNNLVMGIFTNRPNAEDAISKLIDNGYKPENISIITKDGDQTTTTVESKSDQVAEGTVSGATTGGVVGGLAGLLVGIGLFTIPGLGAVLIGGPIAAALGITGGAAVAVQGALTGALAGGLVGGLVSLGAPQEVAEVYERRVKEGAVLLAVPGEVGENTEIRAILNKYGAEEVRVISG